MEAVARKADPDRLEAEFQRMRRLDEAAGIPGVGPYFERVLREGWLARNPEIYHLLEHEGELVAYLGAVPLREASYRSFLEGERYPFYDLHPEDILTPAEHARARAGGLYVWLESYSYRDATAARALGEFAYHLLAQANVRGILATTSRPEDEANCRWWGFQERHERDSCPTGIRKLWVADEECLESSPEHPLGLAVPARSLFMAVRQRFGAAPVLGLSPRQRQVARLFYLEDDTEGAIAARLGIRPDTVKTHLQRIRERIEPHLGVTHSRAVAGWLRDRPAELAETDG